MEDTQFSDLVGKTLTSVEGKVGGDRIIFRTSDGSVYKMYHDPDCCESVLVEDICGDLEDVIGYPIELAEEATNRDFPWMNDESYTWTFYRLRSFGNTVVIRWYGTSNGYYSESVSFEKVVAAEVI